MKFLANCQKFPGEQLSKPHFRWKTMGFKQGVLKIEKNKIFVKIPAFIPPLWISAIMDFNFFFFYFFSPRHKLSFEGSVSF